MREIDVLKQFVDSVVGDVLTHEHAQDIVNRAMQAVEMSVTSANALPSIEMSHAEFLERVQCVCVLYDASWTSGGRTVQRNSHVGGVRRSRHLWKRGAWAVDAVPDENTGLTRQCMVKAGESLGLKVLDEGNHVHFAGPAPVGVL